MARSRHRAGLFFGWEWLAINLDNGRDMLIWRARNIVSGEIRLSRVFLSQPDQPLVTGKDVRAEPLSDWQSPDTFATFPVAWRFSQQELGLDLTFTPARPDCEVPVYGPNSAVWEGHGTVSGTLGGDKVSGCAHLELYGYGFPADFDLWQKRWVARIDAQITRFLPRPEDFTSAWMKQNLGPARYRHDPQVAAQMIAAPAWELLWRGGKHWRSIFGILLLRALGQKVEPYEALVTVFAELLHAGSLMIDDIEDKSPLRRSGATSCLTWPSAKRFTAQLSSCSARRIRGRLRTCIRSIGPKMATLLPAPSVTPMIPCRPIPSRLPLRCACWHRSPASSPAPMTPPPALPCNMPKPLALPIRSLMMPTISPPAPAGARSWAKIFAKGA